jgi:GDP-L-fucose synthase
MVGSACWRLFEREGYTNLVGKSSSELDLRNQAEVEDFFNSEKPEVVIDAAAQVGGILANSSYPYDFLMNNMLIQNNLIESSLKVNVNQFIFLGSSCIYPKISTIPIKEDNLLTKPLEETNQWYALAKISGVKLIEAIRNQHGKNFVALMPTNLYGPGDNFDLNTSHVLPALLKKFHNAKTNKTDVTLWGTGNPLREFLYVDDLAKAILLFVNHSSTRYLYNIGSGIEVSIKELASIIKEVVDYDCKITWDDSKPDGTYRKLLCSEKIKELGWEANTGLIEGIKKTYKQFLITNP